VRITTIMPIVALALLTGNFSYANVAVPEKVVAPSPSDQVSPKKITITPHRAIYDMTLASVKNGSNITGVSGQMLFEWRDACDGWAVEQHLKLHFNYTGGDESTVTSTEITWESKDGKRYNFNIRRVTDDKESERYVGKAKLNDDGSGTVTYTIPAGKVAALPPGTLFPSAHTELILQKVDDKDKLFTRRVFDGTDEDGSNDVSVFIHPPEIHLQETEMNPKLKSSPLLSGPTWPVRMAFFKIDSETGESDYEMDLSLLANGVARSMRIDYGDFSVTGVLNDIEPLPSPGC
jgi:hypothetical protein